MVFSKPITTTRKVPTDPTPFFEYLPIVSGNFSTPVLTHMTHGDDPKLLIANWPSAILLMNTLTKILMNKSSHLSIQHSELETSESKKTQKKLLTIAVRNSLWNNLYLYFVNFYPKSADDLY